MKIRRVERRGRKAPVALGFIARITVESTVGTMVIKECLIVIILHVVEKCMVIIMVEGVTMTAGVVMVTDQVGTTHTINIVIIMTTPQIAQQKGIREDDNRHLVQRDTTVIDTGHREGTKRENYLKVIAEDGLAQLEQRKRNDIIIAQTTKAL